MPQADALVESLRRWDPEQVGGFVVIGRLGAGAMGQVYLGRSAAGRLVAVKTIKTELAEEPDFRTRFGQEVAAARRVSGAFTAPVVAADSEADVPWLATVYVPAPSLSTLVRACGPIPEPAVRWLAAGCAEALESIHNAGLVHRDLKPSNVLVSPDGPRVIDFGLARAAERIQLTVTRAGVGTPAYMAPEQARDNRQATSASDVYSLGATLLFAATGHPPYRGETVMDVLVRLATEQPDLTGLPASLAGVVAACLERDPRNRPTSASIVARLAPELAVAGALGSPPLPRSALDLIDGYRRAPRPAGAGEAAAAESGDEATFGSQPASGPPGLARAGHRQAGWQASRPGGPRGRRALLGIGCAVAGGALVGAGWLLGSRPPPPLLAGQPPGAAQQNPALAKAAGKQAIALYQDNGDSATVFVVHGQGWPPGKPVTVALVGIGSSWIHPVADSMGTFSYAINQDHEFFHGGLPVGTYTVRVTDGSGDGATANFAVQRP